MTPETRSAQDGIAGQSLTAGGRPPRSFRRGRICSEPGCGTRLSIYNPGNCCGLHESMSQVRTRGVPAA